MNNFNNNMDNVDKNIFNGLRNAVKDRRNNLKVIQQHELIGEKAYCRHAKIMARYRYYQSLAVQRELRRQQMRDENRRRQAQEEERRRNELIGAQVQEEVKKAFNKLKRAEPALPFNMSTIQEILHEQQELLQHQIRIRGLEQNVLEKYIELHEFAVQKNLKEEDPPNITINNQLADPEYQNGNF